MIEQRFLRPRLTQVGKIRTGLPPEKGKKHARKLDKLRFTSPAEWLIRAIAKKYGGESRVWEDAPKGVQYEVITNATNIPVYLPRQEIEAWFELWKGNATLERRCTGRTVVNMNRPCLCDPEGVMERDDDRRLCSVVTRMTVMLAEIPGVAGWGVDSHGWNAVDEWSRYAAMLRMLPDDKFWPGTLLLQPRSSNFVDENGKRVAREFNVPIVLFDLMTARELSAGADAMSAVLSGAASASLEAPEQRQAIEAPKMPSGPMDADSVRERSDAAHKAVMDRISVAVSSIVGATTDEQLDSIHRRIVKGGLDFQGSPAMEALAVRRSIIAAERSRERARVAPSTQEDGDEPPADEAPPDDDVQDAEIVEDAEPAAKSRIKPVETSRANTMIYVDIMQFAGETGRWTTSQVNDAILTEFGVEAVAQVRAEQLEGFLVALKAGEIRP